MGLGKLFTLHTEITFADGTTDEIFLKPDPENDCFYHGALKGDIESEVEVDGCKNDAEIVEISSRLVPWILVILLHKETFTIIPLEGTLGSNNAMCAQHGCSRVQRSILARRPSHKMQLPKFTSDMTKTCSVPMRKKESQSDCGPLKNLVQEVPWTFDEHSNRCHFYLIVKWLHRSPHLGQCAQRGGQRGHPTAWFQAVDPSFGDSAHGVGQVSFHF